ncbi:MAG: NAD-dependent epimerase/dehydratase family protein [Acidobacteria bacterium]|nr:NAD-dependent epimerase/dehydratase family protein [Acidobacteriota bacterium]
MTEQQGTHVVLGGGGGLGQAVVRALAAQGRPVRAVNRSGRMAVPAGVEVRTGDALDPAVMRDVCRDAAVVYHCVNAPYTKWPEMCPPIMEAVLEATAAAAAVLVYGDNLYMYGPVDGPIHEKRPAMADGRKGKIRGRVAETVLNAHRAGQVRAVIGRASDFYGPGVTNSAMGQRVFEPAITGRGTINVLGNLDVPHTLTYIDDVAAALITLGQTEEAWGEVWHAPNAEALTIRQFLDLVFEETERTAKVRAAPRFLITLMGLFNPMMRELKEMLYTWEEPYIVDHSKYAAAFGAEPTPHREAVRRTVEWFRHYLAK